MGFFFNKSSCECFGEREREKWVVYIFYGVVYIILMNCMLK